MRTWTTRKLAALAAAVSLLALCAYLAFAVFGVQAAFLNEEVNEEFVVSSETSETTSGRGDTQGAGSTVSGGGSAAGEEPAPEPVLVSSGEFEDVEYEGEGVAKVYRLEDGSHTLRLEGLRVDNGPDLYLYAVAADSARDSASVEDAGFLNLGPLKGNVGDQTYPLPEDFDPAEHGAISVWCQRFSGNFAAASLQSSS